MELNKNSVINLLKTKIKKEEVMAFIGSGISSEAGLPTGDALKYKLAERLPQNAIPLSIDNYNLGVISGIYEKYYKRRGLIDELKELCIKEEIKPAKSHYLIAKHFKIIITTNWDNLIEIALGKLHKRKWHLACNKEQLSLWKQDCPLLLKLHGDLDHFKDDELIITEKDYYKRERDILLVSFLKTYISSKSTIFIGYSLQDYEIKDILGSVFRELKELTPPMYLVAPDAEKSPHLLTWENKIEGISMKGSEFLNVLEQKSNPIYFEILCFFGRLGNEDGEFKLPQGICSSFQGDKIFIVDAKNRRIQKYSIGENFLLSFGEHGNAFNEFDSPKEICSDEEGNLYITDCGGHKILQFNTEGEFIKKIEIKDKSGKEFNVIYPFGIAISKNSKCLYVTSNHGGERQVIKLEPQGSKYRIVWRVDGSPYDKFINPLGVSIGEDENIYVVDNGYKEDSSKHHVLKFSKDGKFLLKIGGEGEEPGRFKFPHNIVVFRNEVYVTDKDHGIQIFNIDGEYVGTLNIKNIKEDFIWRPSTSGGLTFDRNNDLWLVEQHQCKIYKLQKPSTR